MVNANLSKTAATNNMQDRRLVLGTAKRATAQRVTLRVIELVAGLALYPPCRHVDDRLIAGLAH